MPNESYDKIEEIIKRIQKQEASFWDPEDGLHIINDLVNYTSRIISDQSGYNLDYDITTIKFPKFELEQLIKDALKNGKATHYCKGVFDVTWDHNYSDGPQSHIVKEGNTSLKLELDLSKKDLIFSCIKD